MSSQAHPFAQYVRTLGRGKKGSRSLTQEEAHDAMRLILQDAVEPEQLGAFLMLLRVKEESPAELAGFVAAARELIQPDCAVPQPDLDWPSYAGKKKHHPWYVLAALLLAQQGVRIFMHGSTGHTPQRVYTSQVFEALDLPIVKDWQQTAQALKQHNLVYMPLQAFAPRLEHLLQLRHILGLRSAVHSFVRMLNPLNAPYGLQSIFHPPYSPLHQQASQLLGYQEVTVIKGEGGEIELRPDATVKTHCLVQGEAVEEQWPPQLAQRQLRPEAPDVELLKQVWRGELTDVYGEQAIIGTCALALKLMGKADSQQQALTAAKQLWQDRDRSRL